MWLKLAENEIKEGTPYLLTNDDPNYYKILNIIGPLYYCGKDSEYFVFKTKESELTDFKINPKIDDWFFELYEEAQWFQEPKVTQESKESKESKESQEPKESQGLQTYRSTVPGFLVPEVVRLLYEKNTVHEPITIELDGEDFLITCVISNS